MKLTEEQFDKIINTVWALLECDPPPQKETTKYAIEQILTPAAPPRSADDRPIVVFGEPERFKSIDERLLDEIHNSEEPTIRSAEEILKENGLYIGFSSTYTWDGIVKAMHAYASQFRKEVTDEEIEEHIYSVYDKILDDDKDREFVYTVRACRGAMRSMAKWMREKMKGK